MDNDHGPSSMSNKLFDDWMDLQHKDLHELLEALNLNAEDPGKVDDLLRELVEKNIQHFQDYNDARARLAQGGVSAFYTPVWCTSMENSLMWVGGCRPSMFIRLVYAHCGSEFESHVDALLRGDHSTGRAGSTLAELSHNQLTELNNLQRRTIQAEEKVMTELASLHEEIADQPLVEIAKKASQICELDDNTNNILNDHEKRMASVLEEADQLRIDTLKEVINILTLTQAIDYLATSKKLRLCVRAWGQKRDGMRSNQE